MQTIKMFFSHPLFLHTLYTVIFAVFWWTIRPAGDFSLPHTLQGAANWAISTVIIWTLAFPLWINSANKEKGAVIPS